MIRVSLPFIGGTPGMLIVLAMHGYCQSTFQADSESANACISGEISVSGDASDLAVELRSFTAQMILPKNEPVTGIGTFDLGCVQEGTYQVRILRGSRYVVHEEIVIATPGYNRLSMSLSEKRTALPNRDTVSIKELRKKVNAKVASEVRKAREMRLRSQTRAAMTHVMKALDKDPGSMEAYIEAGLIHAGMNDHQRAASAFQRAAELDPDSVQAHHNLAVELLKLKRYSEAEQAARRALQFDRTRRAMAYALGTSLGYQGRNPEEALKYLRRAAAEYPRARLVAAKVLFDTGHKDEAISELKVYLTSNVDAAERAEIEAWLARLP